MEETYKQDGYACYIGGTWCEISKGGNACYIGGTWCEISKGGNVMYAGSVPEGMTAKARAANLALAWGAQRAVDDVKAALHRIDMSCALELALQLADQGHTVLAYAYNDAGGSKGYGAARTDKPWNKTCWKRFERQMKRLKNPVVFTVEPITTGGYKTCLKST